MEPKLQSTLGTSAGWYEGQSWEGPKFQSRLNESGETFLVMRAHRGPVFMPFFSAPMLGFTEPGNEKGCVGCYCV